MVNRIVAVLTGACFAAAAAFAVPGDVISHFTLSGNIMNQLIVGVAIAVLGFWSAIRI